jgi:hypothetical protein
MYGQQRRRLELDPFPEPNIPNFVLQVDETVKKSYHGHCIQIVYNHLEMFTNFSIWEQQYQRNEIHQIMKNSGNIIQFKNCYPG